MSGTYTSNKYLNKPEHGGDIGTWGTGALNGNSTIVDSSLGNVTSISLTGLTTYTLSIANYQNATIKFTGTLADQVVTVLLPTGVSGQFAFIDSTTALGTSSTISLGWTANGVTSYELTPGKTQIVNADGVARVWARSASPSTGGVTYVPISRWIDANNATLTLTSKDLENSIFYVYGTSSAPFASFFILQFPNPTNGLFTVIANYSWASPTLGLILATVNGSFGSATPNQSVGMYRCITTAFFEAADPISI